MTADPRALPLTALVVAAAFALGFFLPDLLGGEVAVASPTPSLAAQAPTPEITPPAISSPTPGSTAAPVATAAAGATTVAPSPSPTPSPSPPAPSPAAKEPTRVPSPTTAQPTPQQRVHVVKPGDNLWDIATRYGVSPEAIVRANRLPSPDSLAVDQKLVIP